MAGAKPGVHAVQLRPICVPESLIKGNKFIRWDESSTIGTPVTLKVDPKGYILYWKDQNKGQCTGRKPSVTVADMDYLDMSFIRDTRTGRYAKVPKEGKLRDTCVIGTVDCPLEDKTVTIAYNKDPSKCNMVDVDFINFVCASKPVAKEWCEELLKYANNLLALNASALSYLEKAHTKLTHVLDVNGRIPVKNIVKMVAKHAEDRRRVEKALEGVGFNAGKNETIDPNRFTFDGFFNFYRHLVGRTEVDKVFDEIGAKKKPYLTVDQFVEFLNREQRDPRLNEILYPYYTTKQAQDLINTYETKTGMAAKGDVEPGHLSQEGFLMFLMSDENQSIAPDLLDLSHDMTQPISHYFINSSHNTYLTGHQLTSKSSVELYRQVLLSGCRCIELDCWDGRGADEEPIITHGYTMCTDISFKEVIEAIAESAFKTSDFPVSLSFENHCSPRQQAKMAAHCRNIFGDMLLTEPLETHPVEPDNPLPSPHQLRCKIIIKNKKRHSHKPRPAKVQTPLKSTPSSSKMVQVNGETKGGGGGDGDGGGGNEKVVSTPSTASEMKSRTESESGEGTTAEKPIDSDEESESDESDFEEEEEVQSQIKSSNFKQDKGTAGKEAEAGQEMSALVNYIQPVHFHTFEISDKRNRSYEISSFVETQALSLLKEYPVDFVNYNKRQMSRIYPRGTRVDSSNFLPQIFWNAGCQLVALNFQTLDVPMQLNLGIFEYNNRSGYILKPDFMRRNDRRFDPFAESTVDGIVAGKVVVKIISGSLLSEKKIGTYVEVEMYGLPTDTVRKKFKTNMVQNNGINPVYSSEPFVFEKVVLPNLAVIRIIAFDENNKMLGHRILPVQGLRPGYRHLPLRNECNLPLLLPSLFVYINVQDYVSDQFAIFTWALSNPIQYLSQLEKRDAQLKILEDMDNEDEEVLESSMDGIKDVSRTDSSSSANPIPEKKSDKKPVTSKISHAEIKQQISSSSDTSNPSDRMFYRMVSQPQLRSVNSINNENGINPGSSKLNDPTILQPTSLEELKQQKPFIKALSKREKEIESLKKKHEKVKESVKEVHDTQLDKMFRSQVKAKRSLEKTNSKVLEKAKKQGNKEEVERKTSMEFDNLLTGHEVEQKSKHKEMRDTQTEMFVMMSKEHYQAELEIHQRHLEPLYTALKEIMEQDHKNHLKRLTDIHDGEVKKLSEDMEASRQKDNKQMSKQYKDKEERARRRREAQQKHVDAVVERRRKLSDILAKKKDELTKALEAIADEFEKEREQASEKLVAEFEEKCQNLTAQQSKTSETVEENTQL
ncbi:1-phosphatidylinositol 4,5-bisphosphate phosphodiesterase beta-1-like isoform X4 [Mizuhopecten yessoensis]|uniref:1-phosphatidylinositol 4,5-bisphosphate phosphodiesterase beta-1-like isoform X4 n=1 Tax=Mizuhopecten yessoensis TaxID=6573 RepID=UPI000B4585A3|nr:1-phosphatidylinositol 4,5-bisphosphate phosphodiesterase beta-1-like isoform X4 [Mizuhopecten yessoensis]